MSVPAYFAILLVVSTLSGCLSIEHILNWTVQGVEEHRDKPLEVMFGDVVRLICSDQVYSNVIYVKEKEQYDACNSSLGGRETKSVGQCLRNNSDVTSVSLVIERASSTSDNGVVFEPGSLYYYYSASDGSFLDTVAAAPYIGGQCLEGLKMFITVEELPQNTSATPPQKTPESKGSSDSESPLSTTTMIIIGSVVGVFFISIAVIVVAVMVLCVKSCSKGEVVGVASDGRSSVVLLEKGERSEPSSSNHSSVQGNGNGNDNSSSRSDSGKNRRPTPKATATTGRGNKVMASSSVNGGPATRAGNRRDDSNHPTKPHNGRPKVVSTPHSGSSSASDKSNNPATRPSGGKIQNSGHTASVTKPRQPTNVASTDVRSPVRRAPEPPHTKKKELNIGDFRMR